MSGWVTSSQRRHASVMSRLKISLAASSGRRTHHGFEFQPAQAGRVVEQALVGGGDRETALFHVLDDQFFDELDARGVEIRDRLVEDPQRGIRQQQACERQAALLARGERTCRQVAARQDADAIERGVDVRGSQVLAQAGQEPEVLARRQVRLERIEVAEVTQFRVEFVAVAADRLAAPVELAIFGRQQAADHAQQRRLADAVGSRDLQELARTDAAGHVTQDVPVAPPRIDSAGLEQGPVECHPASACIAFYRSSAPRTARHDIGREV